MIKACVFDLDGTLANTLESMSHAANTLLKSYGLRELPVDNYRYYCGDGASVLVRRVLIDSGDENLTHYEEMEPLYREKFREDPLYGVTPYPGMTETLEKLKKAGAHLAVCSNKPHGPTLQVITGLFGDLFEAILGQKPDIALKPSPEMPLLLADQMGVKPEECLYIGDTHTDMETGKAAGMITVGALWGYRDEKELLESGARVLAGKPEDLYGIYLSGI